MKTTFLSLVLAAGVGSAGVLLDMRVRACGLPVGNSLEALAQSAVSDDAQVSGMAMARLRAAGPPGLATLVKAHQDAIEKHLAATAAAMSEPEQSRWHRIRRALDTVGRQCDDYASQLYWYTDLNLAKAAAKAQGKPILSLRLLGNLDQEYSCANSRFFRTTLYPNAQVCAFLREHFILHWQSERPVPRITIDFGDGRKIERTITGNSVHYVLDCDGEPVDALPGLYGPKAFLKVLGQAEQAARACSGLDAGKRNGYLRQYHARARAAALKEYSDDLARIGAGQGSLARPEEVLWKGAAPSAQAAGRRAFSKSAIESPLINSLQGRPARGAGWGRTEPDDAMWARIAALHAQDAQLDAAVWSLVLNKSGSAIQASQQAVTKRLVENPFLQTWRNLQRSISEDTVRNEYVLHAQVHDWFSQGIAPNDLAPLNAKVYGELFLMPESDPWLGLAPANVFTGLPHEGLAATAAGECSPTAKGQ